MSSKKEVKKIKFKLWERNLALLNIGSKAAGFALRKVLTSKKPSAKAFLKITEEFSELKGSLMKAGQLLSIYGESFLPEEAIKLLSSLQDQSSYLRFRTLKKSLSKKDQSKLEGFSIKDKPFASASIGQVHLGIIDETEYAVKIQYPDIGKSIDSDLFVLKMLFTTFKVLPKKLQLSELFEQIKKMLLREIDYELERKSQVIYYKNLKDDFIIPKVVAKYSSEKVLVSSYLPGTHIDEINEQDLLTQEQRNILGEDLLHLLLNELFVIQIIQTDPNPANFKIDLNEQKWILYDFGACIEVDDELKKNYFKMIKALMQFSKKDILKAFELIGVYEKGDPKEYENALLDYAKVVAEVFEEETFHWADNDVEKKLIQLGRKLLIEFPRKDPPFDTVFIDRKISGTFYLLKKLKAETKTVSVFSKFFKEM